MFRPILFAAMLLLAACSISGPTPTPANADPLAFSIDAQVEPLAVDVEDQVTVTTNAGRAGLAHFSLFVDGVELSRLSYDGSVIYEPDLPAAMRVVTQNSESKSASWTLETLETGLHEVKVQVSGEISLAPGQSGPPWGWSMADRVFHITVR